MFGKSVFETGNCCQFKIKLSMFIMLNGVLSLYYITAC